MVRLPPGCRGDQAQAQTRRKSRRQPLGQGQIILGNVGGGIILQGNVVLNAVTAKSVKVHTANGVKVTEAEETARKVAKFPRMPTASKWK